MILGKSLYVHSVSDLVALVKPRVTALVVFTTSMGFWMVPNPVDKNRLVWTLLGTVLLVGAANALNMYWERDVDALMTRTKDRPLPAGRMSPLVALVFGLLLFVVSTLILWLKVNHLTALIGAAAFVSYVLLYTPLKKKTHAALLVGAIPGAAPPLMGWTAATDSLHMAGLSLFFILFLWQIPHFLAIALFRKEEYARAGIRVMPVEKGDLASKHCLIRYLAGLIAVSFYPFLLGIANELYAVAALVMGAIFFAWGAWGFKKEAGTRWAWSFFMASIIYLPVLLFVLALTARS